MKHAEAIITHVQNLVFMVLHRNHKAVKVVSMKQCVIMCFLTRSEVTCFGENEYVSFSSLLTTIHFLFNVS